MCMARLRWREDKEGKEVGRVGGGKNTMNGKRKKTTYCMRKPVFWVRNGGGGGGGGSGGGGGGGDNIRYSIAVAVLFVVFAAGGGFVVAVKVVVVFVVDMHVETDG